MGKDGGIGAERGAVTQGHVEGQGVGGVDKTAAERERFVGGVEVEAVG